MMEDMMSPAVMSFSLLHFRIIVLRVKDLKMASSKQPAARELPTVMNVGHPNLAGVRMNIKGTVIQLISIGAHSLR